MPLPPQSQLTWKVCITVLHVVALNATLFRFIHRFLQRKLWWDDYIVIIPFGMDITYLVALWLRLHQNFNDPTRKLRTSPFYSFWLGSLMHFTIIWLSRMSLALSIARIFPPGSRARLGGFSLAFFFGVAYVACVVASANICKANGLPWYFAYAQNCGKTRRGPFVGGLVAVTLDFIGDILLIAFPSAVLWGIKLPPNQRRLVLAAFSASVLTIFAAIVFCIVWYGGLDLGPSDILVATMSAHLEAVVALIVCNLPVVTTYIYCVLRVRDSRSSDTESSFSKGHTGSNPVDSERMGGFPSNRDTVFTSHLTLTEPPASVFSSHRTRSINITQGRNSIMSYGSEPILASRRQAF